MSRHPLFALSLLLGMAFSSAAQDVTVATRVYTEPTGLRFFVDGQPYKNGQVFLWPRGSKHVIAIETEQLIFPGTRSKFNGWADSTGTLNLINDSITFTADPAVTYVKAMFNVEYLLRVQFYQCGSQDPSTCRSPGTVSVNGAISNVDVESWISVGGAVSLQAFPNPGFVFVGWGQPSNYATSFTYNHIMNGPATFSSFFAAGKRVTLLSDPPELLVSPDRTPMLAPAELDWAQGSRHVLGAVSPQPERLNGSRLWVFKDWSNGAQMNDLYTVSQTNVPESLTARFVRGAGVSFVTNPTGLKVKIDGRDNWNAYNFVWGVGMKYSIAAPAEQTDSRGRKWIFKGWSNGGPAAQEVTVTDEHVSNGLRLIANFESQNRLTISTNPPGLPVEVDGKECRGTCVVEKSEGAQILLSAPQTIPISDSSRFDFEGWSDGGAVSRTYTVSANATAALVANFKSSFRLATVAEPGTGANFLVDPASPDGFYPAETPVSITAEVRPGFRFKRWEGDLAGTFRTGYLTMNVPRIVRAFLDISPFIEENGVRNAAGETPEPLVAAGSIASVFGINLAAGYQVGPMSPLAQAIGGVTVKLQNRLLPLLFVSPEQLNILVPSDLSEGLYTIAVKWDSYPEITSNMRVVRNAPGLFQKKVDGRHYAAAAREDGTEVLPQAPAKRGEIVQVFGTGFGPYQRNAPDGFPLPSDPPYALADTVELLIGDVQVETMWAGGVPGQIGTASVRFKLPEEVNSLEGVVTLRLRINGRESNTVHLAVE